MHIKHSKRVRQPTIIKLQLIKELIKNKVQELQLKQNSPYIDLLED